VAGLDVEWFWWLIPIALWVAVRPQLTSCYLRLLWLLSPWTTDSACGGVGCRVVSVVNPHGPVGHCPTTTHIVLFAVALVASTIDNRQCVWWVWMSGGFGG